MVASNGTQEHLDAIKYAVSSTATCTPSVVAEIQILLQTAREEQDSSSTATGRKKIKRPAYRARGKLLTDQVSRPGNKARNVEGVQDNCGLLSDKQRFVFATEVINITLKVLTEAIKNPSTENHPDRPDGLTQSTRSISVQKSARLNPTQKQRPLQDRSHNRVSSSPARLSNRESCGINISPRNSGLIAISECTQQSFVCLRALERNKNSDIDMPSLQLEKGTSALVGKLMGLGFLEQATGEIRNLRRRLVALMTQTVTTRAPDTLQDIAGNSKGTLTDLLDFGPVNVKGPLLDLVVQTQIQVLKLLNLTGRQICFKGLVKHLGLKNPGSPIQLLLRLKIEAVHLNKTSQSLETISQLLLRISLKVLDQEHTKPLQSGEESMEPAFQIYCLGLEVRTIWWKLEEHSADIWKEVLGPFSKIMSKYLCHVDVQPAKKLESAERQLALMCQSQAIDITNIESKKDIYAGNIQLRIVGTLAIFAQKSGLVDDAIKWTNLMVRILEREPGSDSDARLSAYMVRAANLKIQHYRQHQSELDVPESISKALERLRGNIRGETADLENLVAETNSLIKAALSILNNHNFFEVIPEPKNGSTKDKINGCCRHIILDTVPFFLKYLGPTLSDDNTSAKDAVRYNQRKSLLNKWAPQSVDGAFWLVKNLIDHAAISWGVLDNAIQDCLGLLNVLGVDFEGNLAPGLSTHYLKASNLYWTYFQKSRTGPSRISHTSQLRCVRRSVEILENRPGVEGSAGLLAIKLERLSNLLESSGKTRDSVKASVDALLTRITSDVAGHLSNVMGKMPLRSIWQIDDNMKSVERILCALSRQATDLTTETGVYEQILVQTSLGPDIQGGMLEWILGQATQRIVSQRREVPDAFIVGLCKEIYKNYQPYQYSVRRLRVLVLLSWLRFAWPDILDISIGVDAEEEEITSKGKDNYFDQGIEQFLPLLRSSISVFRQLKEDCPDAGKLRAEVHFLSSFVAEAVAKGDADDKIFDIALLTSQLRILSDWAGLHGQDLLRTSVLSLIVQIDMLQSSNAGSDRLVSDLLNLGEQFLLQGYSAKAGNAFEKASDVVRQSQASSVSAFSVHLAKAEYYSAVGKMEKSAKSLAEAQGLVEQNESIILPRKSSDIPADRIQANALIARAWSAQSLVAFQQDDFSSAILSGKQALKLLYRNWSYLSQPSSSSNSKSRTNDRSSEAEVDVASEEECRILPVTAPKNPMRNSLESQKSPELWHGALSLFRAARHQSDLYHHQGLLREALYYCEQAQRVADAAWSNMLIAQNLALTGDLLVRSGKYSEGNAFLLRARPLLSGSENWREGVAIHCAFGSFYRTQQAWQEELVEYEKAEAILKELTQRQIEEHVVEPQKSMASVERGLSKLSMEEKSVKKPIRRVGRKQPLAKARKPATVQEPGKVQTEADTPLNFSFQLSRSRQVVLQRKAITLLAQQQPDLAKRVLQEAESLSLDRLTSIDQKLAFAKLMLFQGISDMIADAVFCVLQDSTISFPSTAGVRRSSDRPRLEGRHVPGTTNKPPSTVISRKTVERSRTPVDENFLDYLQTARNGLAAVLPVVLRSCSTSTMYALTKTLASIAMLESAAMSGKAEQGLRPVALSYTLEMSRMTAMHREQAVERTERLASLQELSSKWPPNKHPEQSMIGLSDLPTDFTEFQQDYIDIIPPKWTAISISLNESGTELILSKMQAGQSPFLLRLPLSRHSSRDADDEEFDFAQGKAELLEIIASANKSTQDARDMTKKGAKSAWWAVRESLDSRLRDLLFNIQSIWIGGFRGLFSQEPRQEQLLARFNQSFQSILNKHLPSRARVKRNKKVETVLETRILELLVGLGDPGEDGGELEEPLTDLLYFIVDILQFNGERNAYDEIDFDNIIIETLDAIRKYYDELKSESSSSGGMHTVLILDQALCGFPWESLPCLDGLSISRLPSLACLRKRILLQQNHENQPRYDGYRINRENGTYVLNPSGDLKNTESTFSSSFSDLKGWTSIVGRAPEETEIQKALLESQLYLYFGHGGGEQYIRARSIKKLEKCAVTMLMGCSSGAMIDAVEFEPYGTPRNYMLAGCPALVATLWDVTDKDIDRFAQDVFLRWGLFDGQKENKSGSKRGGKKREKVEGPVFSKEQGRNSLTEAVAQSRESCVLRYLNGAAPVVYGIPVYLD